MHGQHIDLEQAVPVVVGGLCQIRICDDARVEDHALESAELPHRVGDGIVRGVRGVADDGDTVELLRDGLGALARTAGDGDSPAVSGEASTDCSPDAGVSARDQRTSRHCSTPSGRRAARRAAM